MPPRVLVLTVGTGHSDNLEGSLLVPLRKSIGKGSWERIVLLPSRLTADLAVQLKGSLGGLKIEIRQLPEDNLEDNVDECFRHFDGVLGELRTQGLGPADILVDFTRGTKAMSAALVLAAVRHRLASLRYIAGEQRDHRGQVLPGKEIVREFHVDEVYGRQRLDEARSFFARGQFAAALEILQPGGKSSRHLPRDLKSQIGAIRRLIEFHLAWDRLDHRYANELIELPRPAELPVGWQELLPSPEAISWVEALAQDRPRDHREKAKFLRRMAVDLFANAERRLNDDHLQDVNLRCYRLLELLAEIRLLDRGEDSRQDAKGVYKMIARLDECRDRLSRDLYALLKKGEITSDDRNQSILVHGFGVISKTRIEGLKNYLKKLEDAYHKEMGDDWMGWLALARQVRPTN